MIRYLLSYELGCGCSFPPSSVPDYVAITSFLRQMVTHATRMSTGVTVGIVVGGFTVV